LSGNRHLTFWQVAGTEQELPLAPVPRAVEGIPLLAPPTEGQNIAADYRSQGLTLGRHPLALLRSELAAARVVTAAQLALPHGVVQVAGIVTARQRPRAPAGHVCHARGRDRLRESSSGSACGQGARRIASNSRLLECGTLQKEGLVTHVVARRLVDHAHAGHLVPSRATSADGGLRTVNQKSLCAFFTGIQPVDPCGVLADVVSSKSLVSSAVFLSSRRRSRRRHAGSPSFWPRFLAASGLCKTIEVDFAGGFEGNLFFVLVEFL
jgi:hypothetical protein